MGAEMDGLKPLFGEGQQTRPIVMAGPCSAETEQQTLATARELSGIGIKIFRAGIWKPRTHPGGFEGVGAKGLRWLSRVRQETGMLVATEVATRAHVRLALKAGIDLLWIGARTAANPFAVQEIADAIAESGQDVAVLVKNPVNPDLELWIGALQRIYNAGVRRLGAIHRGFSAYGSQIYRNQPQWRIPIELRRRYPDLPLICDPSHMGGRRDLIATLSQQALDMNYDGLMIESHCTPDEALSDRDQQVSPAELGEILSHLVVRDGAMQTEGLAALRREIDSIDDELIGLLARRMKVACEIGRYKRGNRMPVVQPERYNALMEQRVSDAAALGISEACIRSILATIHEESVRQQLDIVNGTDAYS